MEEAPENGKESPHSAHANGVIDWFINIDFDTKGQLLIIHCVSIKYLWKKWEHNEAVHQLFIDFKKAYDSVRREALYNILIQFGIPKKLVRLIKMCLAETYSRVRVGKNLSDVFLLGLVWAREMLYCHCFPTLG
jgi:hypothetical protein